MLVMDPRTLERIAPGQREVPRKRLDLKVATKFLSERDRLLMELDLMQRMSRRQMGLAMGLSPGNVTRRLQSITARLSDPLIRALCDPLCTLDPAHRQVGIECLLHRDPPRNVAKRHGYSIAETRAMLQFIRGWFKGISTRAERQDFRTAKKG